MVCWPAVFKVNAEDIIATDRQQVQAFLYWCPQDNSNIYAYPLPWVPILDCNDNKVIAIESAHSEDTLPEQCTVAADYAANLFTGEYRTDIKPLDIVQPEGPSFQVRCGPHRQCLVGCRWDAALVMPFTTL